MTGTAAMAVSRRGHAIRPPRPPSGNRAFSLARYDRRHAAHDSCQAGPRGGDPVRAGRVHPRRDPARTPAAPTHGDARRPSDTRRRLTHEKGAGIAADPSSPDLDRRGADDLSRRPSRRPASAAGLARAPQGKDRSLRPPDLRERHPETHPLRPGGPLHPRAGPEGRREGFAFAVPPRFAADRERPAAPARPSRQAPSPRPRAAASPMPFRSSRRRPSRRDRVNGAPGIERAIAPSGPPILRTGWAGTSASSGAIGRRRFRFPGVPPSSRSSDGVTPPESLQPEMRAVALWKSWIACSVSRRGAPRCFAFMQPGRFDRRWSRVDIHRTGVL